MANKEILLESGTNEVEFLEFSIGGQHFAVNVAKLRQTVVFHDLVFTKLPGSTPAMPGMVTYRDSSIAVVDLREFLELGGQPKDPERQLLLIMEFNQRVTGFTVDAVEGIHRVSWSSFAPLDLAGLTDTTVSAVGTITIENRIVLILDMEALLAQIDPTMRIEHFAGQVETKSCADRGNLKIVYAEDSALIQKIAVKTLKDAGFAQIQLFPTGAQALKYIQNSNPGEVDLILSDIEMPEMDGLTLCRQLRTQSDTAKIPFIFFSSLISEEMKRKCEAVGGNGSFSKPEIHLVVDAIEKFLLESKAA